MQAKQIVKNMYKKQNFINEDFFATTLKMNKTPTPTKYDLQKFCFNNQIGTIFFVIKSKLYIVDSISFKVIYTQMLPYIDSTTTVPFFTQIKDIEKGFWDILDKDKIDDYNSYYTSMIIDSSKTTTQSVLLQKVKDLWPW